MSGWRKGSLPAQQRRVAAFDASQPTVCVGNQVNPLPKPDITVAAKATG
jgi:hypothetical protein